MPARIMLVRHGQTDWNIQMRYQGSVDIPLNERGRSEAQCLARRIRSEKVASLYSSGMLRANQFASIAFPLHSPKPLPGMREISFGLFEGLTYDEIMEKHGDVYSRWARDPLNLAVPEGETPGDFKGRVLSAFDAIASGADDYDEAGYVAVVTHGGPISVIVNSILGSGSFWESIPHNGSVTIIEIEEGSRRVLVFNDVSHIGDG